MKIETNAGDYQGFFYRKNVLISGGLGFIGSNLAIRLVSYGARVTIIDSLISEYGGNLRNIAPVRKKVAVNISDVRDPFSIHHHVKNKDLFFNLAGQTSHLDSMENPIADLEINAKAQLSILEACKNYNRDVKIIFASTRQLYGRPQYLPVDEKHPVAPVDINGINKLSGEWYHILYNQIYNIRTAVLRLTNTYGPRMRIKDARQTFLGIWIRNLLENKPILVYGDGSQLRDYNYIDDVVEAMLKVASTENGKGEVYNLGGEKQLSLKKTAEIMADKQIGGRYETVPFPEKLKSIDIGDYYSDYGKIQKMLNWKPKISFEEGIEKTLEYYRNNLKHYI